MTKEAENAIVVGDLKVKEMVDENNNKLNRETQNRWAIHEFISMLRYKAQLYGKQFFTISERNTTKQCSQCNSIKPMKLTERIYTCDKCGFELDRDKNSSVNIYKRALQLLHLS
jgi:putative transposase